MCLVQDSPKTQAYENSRCAELRAANSELLAAMLGAHAQEAEVSAAMAHSDESRALYERLAAVRRNTARLLSERAARLRQSQRLVDDVVEKLSAPEAVGLRE